MQAAIITFKSKIKIVKFKPNFSKIQSKYRNSRHLDQGHNLPPWNLNFEILNGDLTKSITIRSGQELGYFYLLLNRGEEITYKFEKEHC